MAAGEFKTQVKKKILIVEDNPAYGAAACKYFREQKPSVEVIAVSDFKSAEQAIRIDGLSGVITDCFFPRETGSSDIELGAMVIELITHGSGRYAQRVAEAIRDLLPPYTDSQLDSMITDIAYWESECSNHRDKFAFENELVKTITGVVCTFKNQGMSDDDIVIAIKQIMAKLFDSDGVHAIPVPRRLDLAMMNALQESPANQALGILVAEWAEHLSIPFVLATSTFHHDNLTQLVYEYLGERRWPALVDTSAGAPQKSEPAFWAKAYSTLESITSDQRGE